MILDIIMLDIFIIIDISLYHIIVSKVLYQSNRGNYFYIFFRGISRRIPQTTEMQTA